MNRDRTKEIEAIVAKCEDDSYRNGISEGFIVAQRIATWWSSNDHLKEPHSRETLVKWTEDALNELQAKFKTNEKPRVY